MKRTLCFAMNTISCLIVLFILMTAGLYLLGIKPTIITSGSMSPSIEVGDICFIHTRYPYNKIKKYDIIVYQDPRQKVIHRVISITEEGFVTKGDANNNTDRMKTTEKEYLGKFLFLIPKLGFMTTKIQNPVSKAIFITILIAIFMTTYLLNYARSKERRNI